MKNLKIFIQISLVSIFYACNNDKTPELNDKITVNQLRDLAKKNNLPINIPSDAPGDDIIDLKGRTLQDIDKLIVEEKAKNMNKTDQEMIQQNLLLMEEMKGAKTVGDVYKLYQKYPVVIKEMKRQLGEKEFDSYMKSIKDNSQLLGKPGEAVILKSRVREE